MNFFEHKRWSKLVKRLLHDARHARLMREDVAAPSLLRDLEKSRQALLSAWETREVRLVNLACKNLSAAIAAVFPPKRNSRICENIEILVVAVVIAIAFRTYFVQPFKIPTGSMQPTLSGITMQPPSKCTAFDKFPLKYLNMALFSETPVEIRACADGKIGPASNSLGPEPCRGPLLLGLDSKFSPITKKIDDAVVYDVYVYAMEGLPIHIPIPVAFTRYFQVGDSVKKGQLLASGNVRYGDHVFVNRLLYNYKRPQRGDIIVFETDGIKDNRVRQGSFYIKRLAGLPGEEVAIDPPYLVINGSKVTQPYPFQRLLSGSAGYDGYSLASSPLSCLYYAGSKLRLSNNEFLPLGDNTDNSLDGRYFGPVEKQYLLGNAFMIYWPFGARWGHIE